MKFMKIFKREYALELISKGFVLVDKEINYNRPSFNVYIFQDTQGLREEFIKIQSKSN